MKSLLTLCNSSVTYDMSHHNLMMNARSQKSFSTQIRKDLILKEIDLQGLTFTTQRSQNIKFKVQPKQFLELSQNAKIFCWGMLVIVPIRIQLVSSHPLQMHITLKLDRITPLSLVDSTIQFKTSCLKSML